MIADFMFSLSLVDRYSLLNFKVLYKLFFILRPCWPCAFPAPFILRPFGPGPAPFLRLLIWAWLPKLHYLPGTRAKKEGRKPLWFYLICFSSSNTCCSIVAAVSSRLAFSKVKTILILLISFSPLVNSSI